jgi:hypothetical protein
MKIDKKTIVAIVLIAAALLVVVWQIKSSFTPKRPAARPRAAKSQPAVVDQTKARASRTAAANEELSRKVVEYNNLVAALKKTDIDFEEKKFRNPMAPLIDESDKKATGQKSWEPREDIIATTMAGYTIEGIVWDEANPLALVNDQVVGVGDRLDDGSKIVQITKRKVRFTKNGREYFLEFREE